MKKISLIIISVLIMLAFLTGCGGGTKEVESIKVGYLVHVTGDTALWGISEKNGAIIAQEEINEAGGVLGKKLNIIFYDGRGNAADSVNAVKKAVQQDKVVAMLGSNLSGPTIAVGPICASAKIPQVASFATNPKVTRDDSGNVKPWSFRLCFTDPYQGMLIADYAYEKLGKRNAAVLYDITNDYSSGLTDFFIKRFEEKGGKIVSKLSFRTGDVDFRAQLSEIKQKNPDILVLPNGYKEIALIAKQAKDLGMRDIVKIAGDSGYSISLFEMAGPELDGNYYVIQHFSWDDPDVKPIKAKYEEKFNETPEINAAMGYDMVYFIADAIERAGKADGEAIRDAIEKSKDVKLKHASITIDPNTHDPKNKAGIILKFEGGKAVFVDKFAPQD
jgi:branched-chain amino acid transport system substrate-binding protein